MRNAGLWSKSGKNLSSCLLLLLFGAVAVNAQETQGQSEDISLYSYAGAADGPVVESGSIKIYRHQDDVRIEVIYGKSRYLYIKTPDAKPIAFIQASKVRIIGTNCQRSFPAPVCEMVQEIQKLPQLAAANGKSAAPVAPPAPFSKGNAFALLSKTKRESEPGDFEIEAQFVNYTMHIDSP